MIELMLEAERALAVGLLDQAERHYATVAAKDPRNAIAIVGLARVALERGDQLATYLFARKALAIDPDNPAASHLARRMAEQLAMRGEPVPGETGRVPAAQTPAAQPSDAARVHEPADTLRPTAEGSPRRRAGFLDRLRRRSR